MKIGLGTVQFGIDYGISNPEGQTAVEEVLEILTVANKYNLRIIDTAAVYGNSESVLGNLLPARHGFKIVTKTPRFDTARISPVDASLLEKKFHLSLQRLRASSIYGLLIHNADDLLLENGQLLMRKMTELKQQGLVEKIGVSVYTAEHIDRVMDNFSIDIIQVPINVFDQRLLVSGHLKRLKEEGIEIHARSVFLQGLLLMEPQSLPPYFSKIKDHMFRYRQAIKDAKISPVSAALGFVVGRDEVDCAICGVNNHRQFEEICSGVIPIPTDFFAEFSLPDEDIINPSKWRL